MSYHLRIAMESRKRFGNHNRVSFIRLVVYRIAQTLFHRTRKIPYGIRAVPGVGECSCGHPSYYGRCLWCNKIVYCCVCGRTRIKADKWVVLPHRPIGAMVSDTYCPDCHAEAIASVRRGK